MVVEKSEYIQSETDWNVDAVVDEDELVFSASTTTANNDDNTNNGDNNR